MVDLSRNVLNLLRIMGFYVDKILLTLPEDTSKNYHWTKCRSPNLGLVTKARVCKCAGQHWSWESHFMFPGVQKSVREWTLTLPSEFPFWELESQWTPESLEGDFRGWNSLDWRVPFNIGKLFEHRCLKWVHMTHLNTWNISYGQKKGRESNK
jgi:hypothetical protein